jgi:hypothetical protein
MADNDNSIIKPVETLQNVPALAPAKRREERRSRRQLRKQEKQQDEQEHGPLDEASEADELGRGEGDEHSIDYCA